MKKDHKYNIGFLKKTRQEGSGCQAKTIQISDTQQKSRPFFIYLFLVEEYTILQNIKMIFKNLYMLP